MIPVWEVVGVANSLGGVRAREKRGERAVEGGWQTRIAV